MQLSTVRPNGRGLHQITNVAGDAIHPDWSPDGRTIVFELDTEEGANVAFMGAGGGPIRVVPAPAGTFEGQPSFMPDGDHVLFTQDNGAEEATWIMRLDGRDRHRITAGSRRDRPERRDRRPPFQLRRRARPQLGGRAGADHEPPRRHAPAQADPFATEVAIKQDWAPDGSRLVFTDNADFVRPGESANIATIRPDGTGTRYLTHYTGGEVNAFVGGYSPNGRRIAFRDEDHGQYALMTMRADGTHLRTVLPLSAFRPRYIDWGTR